MFKVTSRIIRATALAAAATAIAIGTGATARADAAAVGVVADPCAFLPAGPAAAPARAQLDWANLCRYRAANLAFGEPGGGHADWVFIGDSITEMWGSEDPAFFTHGVVDRGISGQTTPQMLLRFRADVIDLHPRAVHILAGINDIAGNTGPTTLGDIENNIASMVDLARAHGIRVILGSVTPAAVIPWRTGIRPAATIHALNAWLSAYARRRHLVYVDYYAALADGHGAFKAGLSSDGLHPNRDGFGVMEPLTRAAMRDARRDAREP